VASQSATTGLFHVGITATDDFGSDTLQFDWAVRSFTLAQLSYRAIPQGAPVYLSVLASNGNNRYISYSVSGLPPQFYIDANGFLRGSFDVASSDSSYDVTIHASRDGDDQVTTLRVTTTRGFTISNA